LTAESVGEVSLLIIGGGGAGGMLRVMRPRLALLDHRGTGHRRAAGIGGHVGDRRRLRGPVRMLRLRGWELPGLVAGSSNGLPPMPSAIMVDSCSSLPLVSMGATGGQPRHAVRLGDRTTGGVLAAGARVGRHPAAPSAGRPGEVPVCVPAFPGCELMGIIVGTEVTALGLWATPPICGTGADAETHLRGGQHALGRLDLGVLDDAGALLVVVLREGRLHEGGQVLRAKALPVEYMNARRSSPSSVACW